MGKKFKNEAKKSFVDCYYMTQSNISVSEIYEIIKEEYQAEYWEIAGVIEVELGEKSSIDIEEISMFKSDEDKIFIDKNNVVAIFSIKTDSDNKDKMIGIFRKVVAKLGGFVCSDTEDFKPLLVK